MADVFNIERVRFDDRMDKVSFTADGVRHVVLIPTPIETDVAIDMMTVGLFDG